MNEHKFGEILRNARMEHGISQAELSKMTGFTVRAISFWENGKREISLKNAVKIAKALNMDFRIGTIKLY